MPREISVEMTVNAWVLLRGYRRGGGKTILGIGYDLLAGLSQWEMQGVLAHEITHAKLVQRGFKTWLNRGLNRMVQLAKSLNAHLQGARKSRQLSQPAPFLFVMADRLTRQAARLVAGCSRQDEFEADRGAAELCGPGAIRSSLLKLEGLAKRSARLPWNERVARLQGGEGFSQWLAGELSPGSHPHAATPQHNLFFQYSTHPSLADRLAALPPGTTAPTTESALALGLLNEPDKVAETLICEIQRFAAEEEQKDSRRLRKWTRKSSRTSHLRPLQALGVFLLLAGVLGGTVVWLALGMSFGLALFILGTLVLGALGYRLGRHRERFPLAVPEFGAMQAAWQNPPKVTPEAVQAMETEFQKLTANVRKKGKKERELAAAAYTALSHCDYARAHCAARLCLEINPKSIEGAAGFAVAAAALGQVQRMHQALRFLQQATGMYSPSVRWSAGWALLLCGDWAPAEAFLEPAQQGKTSQPHRAALAGLVSVKSRQAAKRLAARPPGLLDALAQTGAYKISGGSALASRLLARSAHLAGRPAIAGGGRL